MSGFELVTITFSFVLGLGVAQILSSLSSVVRDREAHPLHWLPISVALAIFLARTTRDKALIRAEITERFGYDLDRTIDEIRPAYAFDVSCQGTVPEAIIAFLESGSYEDAVRNAVSLGGDSDTLGCITGGMAEAYYGVVPIDIRDKVSEYLSEQLWSITEQFCNRYTTE